MATKTLTAPLEKKVKRETVENLAPLRKFFFKHGHVHVPNFPEYEAVFDLCNKLRIARYQLPSYVVDELDAMGFLWDLHLSNDLRWYYHYNKLKEFYNEYGHTRIPAKRGDHKELGAWVQRQRTRASKLSSEQKKLLNELKFQWSEDVQKEKDAYWKSMFKKLSAFYDKFGHSSVPDRYKDDEKLGRWVSTVRYGEKHLASWKKQLLKSVKFKFSADIKKDKLSNRQNLFNKLKAYYEKHGHANVPEGYTDHKLSIFVAYLNVLVRKK
jgi:hypothetical protein